MQQVATLVFLRRGNKVLLAMKKRGHGAGYWNGVGGKVEAGEGIEAAAIREVEEEIGVTPLALENVGELQFHYPHAKTSLWIGHLFVCWGWRGEPTETAEMAPRWFDVSSVPYDRMWADDAYWLPCVLAGQRVRGEFTFGKIDKVVSHVLEELS